jgi:hypothetical protein
MPETISVCCDLRNQCNRRFTELMEIVRFAPDESFMNERLDMLRFDQDNLV